MITAMFCFAWSDTAMKLAASIINPAQLIFLMGVYGTIIFVAYGVITRQALFERNFFHTPILLRNLFEIVGAIGIVLALVYAPLTSVSAIQQTMPFVVTAGAAIVLKERVGWRRWSAICVGFLCVILIIRPGSDVFEPAALWALGNVFGLGFRELATKKISVPVTTLQLAIYAYLLLIPTGLAMMVFWGDYSLPGFTGLAWALLISILTMIAYLSITTSVRVADLSAIMPFRYTRLLFTLLIGVFLLGERPDMLTYIGMMGVVASGLFLLARESKT